MLGGAPAASAIAASPAAVQYELAPDSSGPARSPDRGSAALDYSEERPAGIAIGSLDDEGVILLLALILILTAALIGLAWRRQRLASPTRTLVLALAGLTATAFLIAVLPAGGVDRKPPAVPKVFYGMLPQLERPASEYKTMKRGGVDSVRFPIPWSVVETSPGNFDFSLIDRYVERIARARLEIFPSINATPTFYGVNCSPADCFRSLPSQTGQQKAAWRRFLQRIVERYGPRGRFWAQNPGVPKKFVRIYQIWNEENFEFFTEPRNPRLFAELVRISDQAIASRDRRAKVVLGGLFAHPRASQGIQATTFLNRVYKVRGIKSRFDGVALHPYAKDASDLRPDIRAIRRVMRRNGDARTPLYLTEIGWGSGRDTAFEKGPRGQVRELTQAFNLIRQMRRSARIQRVFWFSWEDLSGSCNFCDSTGLWTENAASPKRSWFRYRAFALNRR